VENRPPGFVWWRAHLWMGCGNSVGPLHPPLSRETAGSLVTDPDDPRPAALAADRDLPALQVHVTAQRILRVIPDPGEL
jgi:hypothetical protein